MGSHRSGRTPKDRTPKDRTPKDRTPKENTPERSANDHFGLFGAAPDRDEGGAHHTADGAADDGADKTATTGEMNLDELRDVLAGRREPDDDHGGNQDRDDPAIVAAPVSRRRKRRRHPVRSTLLAIVVMALIVSGVTVGVIYWQQSRATPDDWAGAGTHALVVRVQSGEGLYDVGGTLVKAGVVASVTSFVDVAGDDGRLGGLQPGYYMVHEHSSAQTVVDELADPANRLGQLRIIPGQTLADITTVSTTGAESTRPGILTTIAKACVPTSDQKSCFSVDDLWTVEQTAKLNKLGVVGWALDQVANAPDPKKRLEGLILPGDYDIAPGSTAQEALTAVVSASAARWNTTDIVAAAEKQHMTPYQLAIIASLVQAEAIGPDMRKVSRVIDNRLRIGMKLQFDSTVNYGLDRAQISTTNDERLDPENIYSTYAHGGLPPTPIGASGPTALDAADDPAVGDWLYFVAIDLDGNSCFSPTLSEHEACVDKARANGVFG